VSFIRQHRHQGMKRKDRQPERETKKNQYGAAQDYGLALGAVSMPVTIQPLKRINGIATVCETR
jgi:hypothetical protein